MRGKRGQSPPPRPPEEPSFNTREFSAVRALPPPPPPREDSDDEDEGGGFKLPVDQWRLLAAIKRRWMWLVAAAGVAGVLGFAGGTFRVPYKIEVTLIRPTSAAFDSGMVGGAYRPEQLSIPTLVNLIKSPGLIHQVATNSRTPVSEKRLKKSVEVKLELQSELVTLTIPGKTPQSLLELATNYVNEVVKMGKDLQISAAVRMNAFYSNQIAATQVQLNEAENELNKFKRESKMVDPDAETLKYANRLALLGSKIDETDIEVKVKEVEMEEELKNAPGRQNPIGQELADAQIELRKLLTKLQDKHPDVIKQRSYIEDLQRQLNAASTNPTPMANVGASLLRSTNYYRLQSEKVTLQSRLKELARQKIELEKKAAEIPTDGQTYAPLKASVDRLKGKLAKLIPNQVETQLYIDEAPGYYKLVGMEKIDIGARWMGVIKFAMIGFILGALGAGAVVAGFEVLDDSLKTTVDVERVTGLPMLATLGDLNTMSLAEKEGWAFRTWTALSGQLSPSPNHGMVCGFISSLHGEGRSTWINLLVNAAGQRGFRVLTVATRPPRSDPETGTVTASETEREFGDAISRALAATKIEAPDQVATLTPQALVFPAEVSRQLTGPNAPPVAHIPLPGWVWNLERRKQWQSALAHWRAIDNLVLLVELPPASVPESVLLAENLPQLIWLVDSGKPRRRATHQQLETLRYAKCRLVGAVLNHEPKPVFEL